MSAYSDLILGHANLVGYWRLNESGGDALDAEGSNDGSVTGATQNVSGIRLNDGDTAYSFDGVNDVVTIPYTSTLNPSGSFTIEAWFYLTGGVGTNRRIMSTQTGGYGYALFLQDVGGENINFLMGDGSSDVGDGVSTVVASLRTWYHAVGVFEASSGQTGVAKLYVNGSLVWTSASFTHTVNTTDTLTIGNHNFAAQWFPGKIDEVAIYNDALDATTIQEHYDAISPGPYTVAATARLGTATALQASTGKVWEVGDNLYTVAAETGDDDVHVYKSTDYGITWAQQDAADAPAAIAGPFDSYMRPGGSTLYVMRSSAATTLQVRTFDCSTDQWAAADVAGTPPGAVSLTKNARIVVRSDGDIILAYTSSSDDADIHYARNEGGTWTSAQAVLAANSTAASVVVDMQIDSTDMAYIYYLDVVNGDLSYRSLSSANSLGTETDIDTAASVSPTDHTYAGQFRTYDASGTDKMTVAMNNSSDVLESNEITLESASAGGNVAAQQVVNNTRLLGENVVSTALLDTTRYIFFSDADDDDIYYHTSVSGAAWSAEQTYRLMTDAATTQLGGLSNVLGGLYLLYCENATVKGEWIVDPDLSVDETGTATVGTAAAAGGTHTGTGVVSETGTTTVGTAAAAGGTHTGTGAVNETGNHTVGTASAIGGSHTATGVAHQTGTATVGTAAAAGGAHVGTGVVNETGTATVGTASADGGAHTGSAATTGVATVGTAPAAGGTHTGSYVANQTGTHTASDAAADGGTHTAAAVVHETGTHTASNAAATGGSHTGSAATIGAATVGTASATGGTHTGDASVVLHETGTATVGTASAAGGSHTATAGIGTTGTTTTGTAAAAGGAHSSTADTAGAHTVGTASATGHTATGTAGTQATGTATVGTATAAGGSHTASAQAIATATVGTAAAEGFSHTGVSAAADDGIHVRGQATAEGGTHTGVVTASATTTTGTASAQGGTHTAGYSATGEHTTGTAAAAGGSHVGSAGTTGTAVSGSVDAAGASHTATASTTGAHVVGTAVATGHDATGTIAYTGSVIVGEATATGGDHSATATSVGLVVVGEATAEGGLHIIRVGELLDEYIPAGRVVTIIPAGRVSHGTVPAGRTSELIPAGKP